MFFTLESRIICYCPKLVSEVHLLVDLLPILSHRVSYESENLLRLFLKIIITIGEKDFLARLHLVHFNIIAKLLFLLKRSYYTVLSIMELFCLLSNLNSTVFVRRSLEIAKLARLTNYCMLFQLIVSLLSPI